MQRMQRSHPMNEDKIRLPDLTPYMPALIIGVLLFWVLWFPVVAAIVAPHGRRFEFFLLTLLVLFGPLGVAWAAVANPRA